MIVMVIHGRCTRCIINLYNTVCVQFLQIISIDPKIYRAQLVYKKVILGAIGKLLYNIIISVSFLGSRLVDTKSWRKSCSHDMRRFVYFGSGKSKSDKFSHSRSCTKVPTTIIILCSCVI